MYSQNDEEKWIEGYFANKIEEKKVGRFLDIGAYDGKTFSNTHRLFELGWFGVCVEPSPSVFVGLLKLYGREERIQLVNAAVGPNAQLMQFHDSGGDAVSTLSKSHRDKWDSGSNFKSFFVPVVTVYNILTQVGFAFDFINIDIEGTNLELLKTFPPPTLRSASMVCIEHDGHAEEMLEILQSVAEFKELHRNGENLIVVK